MFLRRKKRPRLSLSSHPSYPELVRALLKAYPLDQAMQTVGGGGFEPLGLLERALVIQWGLGPNDYLIDVGCGSGRLANALSDYLSGKYLGIDVVPELIDYASALVRRPDWRFESTGGRID